MSNEEDELESKEIEEELDEEEGGAVDAEALSSIFGGMLDQSQPRIVGLFGDIDEEKASAACASLISFFKSSKDPIELFLSTNGGSADEMYAIVDVIEYLKSNDCEVHIRGIGKIMSAGILILACGTKGERKVGKNTRLMMHPVQGGIAGPFPSMKDDLGLIKKMQEKYIHCLSELTNLSIRQVRAIVNKRRDTYFDAEEAIEMGLVDSVL